MRFERGMSANTVSAYGRDLARFAAFLADRGVRPAAPRCTTCGTTLPPAAATARASSVARRTASLRAFYAYLVREGLRDDDPAAGLRTPKRPQQLPRVLSVEEVEAVLATVVPAGPLGQRDLAALELLYGCGLRASELLGLRDGDVDLEGGLVRCIGKGDKERVVPMGGAAAAALETLRRRRPPELLRGRRRAELFLNARGGPLTRQGLDYRLRRILARADMLGRRAPTPSATRSPRICSPAAPTCAACRRCSDTPTWRPPSSTLTSLSNICVRCSGDTPRARRGARPRRDRTGEEEAA